MPKIGPAGRFTRNIIRAFDAYLRKYVPWHRIRVKWSEKERRALEEIKARADREPTIENLTDLRIEVERIQSERGTIDNDV